MAIAKIYPHFFFFLFSYLFLIVSCQGSWIEKKRMPTKRSDLTAVTIGDQIIVSGGCDQSQVCPADATSCFCPSITSKTEAYKPLTDDWVTLADMPIPRFRHAATSVGSKMYLIGGRDINDTIIQTVDVYDSVANSWTTLKSLWTTATSDLVAASLGTNIYAISGYTQDYASVSSVWVLDTVTGVWLPGKLASMSSSRGDACAVTIDKKIYVFGGFSDINFCAPLDTLEIFDPIANAWSTKSHLHYPRGDAGCGVQHGEFHAIGGEQKNNVSNCAKYDVPIRDVEHYHQSTDTWTDETSLPSVRFRFSSASYGDTFYIFGGQGGLDAITLSYPVLDVVEAWQDNYKDANANVVDVSFVLVASTLALLVSC